MTNKTTAPMMTQIEALVKDVPGWTPIDQLYTLFTIAHLTANVEGDVVEVGSWCGRSAVVLGLAAKLAAHGKVHCVDLFPERKDWKQNPDGTYSFEVEIGGKRYGGYTEVTVWKETFESQHAKIYEKHSGVLEYFNETISTRGLQDVVHPHKGDLETLLRGKGSNFKCRMAFLDGDHSFEAVASDIRNIDKCLIPGGWLCFDDAFSSYEGVNRAITELVLNNPQYGGHQQMTRKLFVARKRM